MVVEQSMAPDERVLRAHVASAQFINGVECGKWRIVGGIDWPSALVAVSAASREGAPEEFFFRCDLAGYPNAAPTATPWDPATGDVLDEAKRPKGDGLGLVFRTDWEGGRALYAPFDRVALSSHDGWQSRYPRRTWDATKTLAWILQILHAMLNDAGYAGI